MAEFVVDKTGEEKKNIQFDTCSVNIQKSYYTE